MFSLTLFALNPMVGSYWRNHVQMAVTPHGTASCVNNPMLDSIEQLVVVDYCSSSVQRDCPYVSHDLHT
jgi:hypothetical protein